MIFHNFSITGPKKHFYFSPWYGWQWRRLWKLLILLKITINWWSFMPDQLSHCLYNLVLNWINWYQYVSFSLNNLFDFNFSNNLHVMRTFVNIEFSYSQNCFLNNHLLCFQRYLFLFLHLENNTWSGVWDSWPQLLLYQQKLFVPDYAHIRTLNWGI